LYNSLVEEDSCKEIDAYESILNNIVPVVFTGSSEPLFQIIKPNVVNNVDLDCPMGLSVFANAIDNLKGTDLIYDSYCMEFELGKKRLLVPVSMAKMQMASDGITTPVFDSNDITFYAVPDAEDFHDLSPTIRAQEHEMGIQKALSLLSNMCGLGNDRYSFEKGISKTATEVISEKSELFQNRQKHNIIVVDALIKMVKAIGFLSGKKIKDVTIDTDDSIIQDENATIERNILLLSNGLQTKVRALMEIHKMTEDDANKLLEQIKKESEISGDNVDIIGMGEDNDTDTNTGNSTDNN
jgi:A118 family predicted phage portal protein